MRYTWTSITIFGIWVAIAIILYSDAPIDGTNLYLAGVVVSVILAIVGFRSTA